MKSILIVIGILSALVLVWFLGTISPAQGKITIVNDSLLQLSYQLLKQVKLEENTIESEQALLKVSVAQLEQGLPNDTARNVFWINLYNAYFQIFASREKKSNDEIFRYKGIRFADVSFSLDDVEHGILRKFRSKYSLGYLPQFFPTSTIKKLSVKQIDYRIHFALNCGAASCPPIAFYRYEKLSQQLELAARAFLTSETNFDDTAKIIYVTKLFQWFRGDFEAGGGVHGVIKKHTDKDITGYKVKYNEYDWTSRLKNFQGDEY